MKKIIMGIFLFVSFSKTASAMDYAPNTIIISYTFNLGSFSAGEYDGGSVFLGGSLSVDWIPNGKIGLSFGIESGLLGGRRQENNGRIFGIPVILRLGWHPAFFKFEKIDLFVLAKLGWGFGIWGGNLEEGSTSGGIICGINLGCNFALTNKISAYTDIGYNYYGLARNSNYPEYPLGYGSGKVYTSVGVSLKIFEETL